MVRVFVISDYYTHFYYSTNASEFYTELARYVNTMIVSQKQNTYLINCFFMEEAEYQVYVQNFNKVKRPVLKPNLKLVKEERDLDGEDFKD
jgi:hypothetical protein